MKERQRWRSEEDAILRAYVKRYGAKEWNLVSQRMNVPLQRDAKSCLERWKNYLKPGIKKGSLTEEEQRLVIHLQSKHGNKWKKIAAEVPGRTAKRLGKWWEVFKEKQNRESSKENTNSSSSDPIQSGKYDLILESFAEKLVNQRPLAPLLMAAPLLPLPLPPPSVALTLSQSATDHPFWMTTGLLPPFHHPVAEVVECCREVQEGHRAWAAQRKEAAWRLKRVELQIEAEKACKRKEMMEEMESKVREVMEEQRVELERIDAEYRERTLGIWRDAEDEEKKLVEIWEAKHGELRRLMEKKMTSRH